jgi:Uma2 family endonuclease
MTAEELWTMPSDDHRNELVRGELRTMAPPGYEHAAVQVKLVPLLADHVEAHGLGDVLGELGFVLSRNPDTVRAPDIAFVGSARVAAKGRTAKYWEGPPDLAVEILSPWDTAQELDEKVDEYLNAGTASVWVVNPRRKTVTVHRPGPVVLRETDILKGDDVLPGFHCAVARLFV